MRKVSLYLWSVLLCLGVNAQQNTGIGGPPDASAKLDIQSTTSGVVFPRMTTYDRDHISLPTTGLMIYNTDCGGLNIFDGTVWSSLSSKTGGLSAPAPSGNQSPCQNSSGESYSIADIQNASHYIWSVPPGSTILSGQGSASITVHFGTTDGNVTAWAVNDCETSAAGILAMYLQAPPDAPQALDPFGATGTEFYAYWNQVGNGGDYFLDVSIDDFTTFVPGYENVETGNTNAYYVQGLDCDHTYHYRVRAANYCGGLSGNSGTIDVAMQGGPAAPSELPASSEQPGQFDANWNGVDGASGYYLDVATDNPLTAFVSGYHNLYVGGTSTTVSGLSCNTNYYYQVRAANNCATGQPSGVVAATPQTAPSAPTGEAATAIQNGQFDANWDAVSGATIYYLDVSTDENFGSFVGAYNNLNVNNVTTTTVSGLNCNTLYYYRVRAANGCGTGASLDPPVAVTTASGITQPGNIQSSVFSCSGSNITEDLSVSPVSGATSYTWTVPAGVTLNSGQGSNTINVTIATASGDISVTASNDCGTSTPSVPALAQLSGWQYRQTVSIDNTSGTDLSNYQVELTIAFISGHMNDDFSDIRFVDGGGNPLNYYIASYNSASSADVWVNVPSISAAGGTIYMVYGNSGATTTSNAATTFDFYDACTSSSTGWTFSSQGDGNNFVDASNGYFNVTGVGCCGGAWGTGVAQKQLASPLTSGAYVVSFQNRNGMGVCSGGGFALLSDDGTGVSNGGDMYVQCNVGNYCSGENHNGIQLAGTWSAGGYYTNGLGGPFAQFDIKPMDVTNRTATLYKDGSQVASVSGGGTSLNLTAIVLTASNNAYGGQDEEDFQNIIIRKYANPEPSGTFGSEQSCQ